MRALWSTEWLYTVQQMPSCKCKPSANMNTIGSANSDIFSNEMRSLKLHVSEQKTDVEDRWLD